MGNLRRLAIFGLGIALLIVAFDALGSGHSETFVLSGIAQPNSPWLLAGGSVAILAGLLLAFTGRRND